MPDHHQNMYELRSSAVQEVLRKPPTYLIIWANVTILVIIVIAFILLSVITIPADSNGAYLLKETKRDAGVNSILLETSLPVKEIDKLYPEATVYLYPSGDNSNSHVNAGVIFRIDSVYQHTDKVYLRGNVKEPFIIAYPSGKIRVSGAPESLRHRLFKKISL